MYSSRIEAWKADVAVGIHDIFAVDKGPAVTYGVSEIHVHPLYEETETGKLIFDVALLKLENELEFNDMVSPLCLPNKGRPTFVYRPI